jgi:hypothetical protein
MAQIKISINNVSSTLTDDQVRAVVPALQTQVSRDFAPPWGSMRISILFPKANNHQPDTGGWWCWTIPTKPGRWAITT